jgi:hypothetical protein
MIFLFLALFSALFVDWRFPVRAMSLGLSEFPLSPFGEHELFGGGRQFRKAVGTHRQFRECNVTHIFPECSVGPAFATGEDSSDLNAKYARIDGIDIPIPFAPDMFVLLSWRDYFGTLSAHVRLSSLANVHMNEVWVTLGGRTNTHAATHKTQDASARARTQAASVLPVPRKAPTQKETAEA